MKPTFPLGAPGTWLSLLLCKIGMHDWRRMDGTCCECGYADPFWHNDPPGWFKKIYTDYQDSVRKGGPR